MNQSPKVTPVGNLNELVRDVKVGRRSPVTHRVKSWPEVFRDALTGRKRFEVRRDDRDPRYMTGDTIELQEWMPNQRQLPLTKGAPAGGTYTGRSAMFVIGYLTRDAFLPEGFCAFDLISTEDINRLQGIVLVRR